MSEKNTKVIFRRFRKLSNGKVLDAWTYGLRAWPITIGIEEVDKEKTTIHKEK